MLLGDIWGELPGIKLMRELKEADGHLDRVYCRSLKGSERVATGGSAATRKCLNVIKQSGELDMIKYFLKTGECAPELCHYGWQPGSGPF